MNFALKTEVLLDLLHVDVDAGTAYTAGDPLVAADGTGIAKQDYATDEKVAATVEGLIRGRIVEGALARGDVMGFDNDAEPFGGTAGTGAWTKVHSDSDFQNVAVVINAVDATARQVDMWIRPALGLEDSSAIDIWVDKAGDDTTGLGTFSRPYLTVTAAVAAMTATRKNIRVGLGEFEEAGTLTMPTDISGWAIIGIGNRWETVISAAAGDEVIDVSPGVQTSTYEFTLQNLQIDHDTSGQDGLKLDNTSMTKKLNAYLGVVGFAGDGADNGIVCTHTDTGNAIRVYWDGGNGDCESGIDLAQANDGDRFYVDNVIFSGDDIDVGTNIAGTTRLRWCQLGYRTFTGGGAANIVILAWCVNNNSGTFSAADAADVTTNSSITGPQIVGT